MERIPGPDFPTAGFICGRAGIRQAYRTGRGSVVMRARAEIEVRKGDKRVDRRHRDPLPGQQGAPHREDRRAGSATSASRASPTSATRATAAGMRIVVDVTQGRAQPGHPEQPLQAHPAPGHLRHHHAGHRRPAPAGPEPAGGLRALHRLPPRGGAPAHRLRAAQGGGAGPHPGGLRHRPRPPRRGDRPHPRRASTPAEATRRPHRPASASARSRPTRSSSCSSSA